MASILTFFEYETKEYSWTDRELNALARLQSVGGVEALRATILNGKRAFKTTQHVGVFRFGNTTAQILPKIYRSSPTRSRQDNEQVANRNLLLSSKLCSILACPRICNCPASATE